MSSEETPVLLLTGYLGSGKTTLVNHILSNRKGIRFAVIVNDIGEVNIDADLIQKGGIVDQKDDSLVALQNGCICCTLQTDLIDQIVGLIKQKKFDYIVIEASGICEPEPIARTIASIPQLGEPYTNFGLPRLDCIVTVVDALRMESEFDCGDDLTKENIDEEDIENLVIQQIEFCNIILLNKVSEVEPKDLERIRQIVRTLQPEAKIIECDYADVELERILDTGLFNYGSVAASAGWIKGVESVPTAAEEAAARGEVAEADDDEDEHGECGVAGDEAEHGHGHGHHHDHDDDDDHDGHGHHHHDHDDDDHDEDDHDDHGHHHHDDEDDDDHDHEGHHHHDDDDEDHDHDHDGHHHHDDDDDHDHDEHGHHHHHHHHHHDEGEAEEYGIGTFVYYRRAPFDINKFDNYVAKHWPSSVIRAKGLCYFHDETDMSYLFEQAGKQKLIRQAGRWYATAPKEDLMELMTNDPGFLRDWDEKYGDRMQKIVFIGQHMDQAQITADLDACLTDLIF